MADIVDFVSKEDLKMDAETLLEIAFKHWNLQSVVICGHDDEGNFIVSGCPESLSERVFMLEKAKRQLFYDADG